VITVTTTGVAFIFISVGVALCGFRFIYVFKKDNSHDSRKLSLLIGMSFLSSATHGGLLGIGALFFLDNYSVLSFIALGAQVFLIAFATVSVFTVFYVLYPKLNKYLASAIPLFLGLASIFVYVVEKPQPYLVENNVSWDLSYLLSVLTFYLFFLAFGALFGLFAQLAYLSKSTEVRVLACVISVLVVLGLINVYLNLILFYGGRTMGGFSGIDFLNTGLLVIGVAFIGLISYMHFVKK